MTYEVPEGWKELPLTEALFFQEGPGLLKKQFRDTGIPFLNIRTFKSGRVDRTLCQHLDPEEVERRYQHFLLEDGDIICSSSGTIGRIATINERDLPLMLNTSVIRFRPLNEEEVERGWIKLFLQSQYFLNQARGAATGSAQVNFGPTHLKLMSFVTPPVEQQKRIVAKIEELFSHIDAGIEALNKAKQLLKQYRQSVLKAAVTGELTKEWREQNKDKLEPASQLLERILTERRQKWEEQQLEQFKAKGKMPKNDKWKEKYKEPDDFESLPFDIPESWGAVTLDYLINHIEAGKSFKCDERPPEEGETGIVKVSAVSWGEFDSNESKTIMDESKINDAYRINEGDFLFSRANTIELVGACVIVKTVGRDLLLSDKILRFIIDEKWKEWILLCLRTWHGRNEIEGLATGNQESMRNIGQARIKQIRIPLMPEGEKEEIVLNVTEKMSSIERLENEIKIQQIKAEKNKQAILAAAFSGELTHI